MKIMLSKALILAVIVLFVGAGVVPSISSDNEINPITKTIYVEAVGTASKTKVNNGSLSGYVTDPYMNPIEKARVRVYFHETYEENYTDSFGYYNVTNIPICYCLKNATASKGGYTTEWVLLAIGENTTNDFILAPLYDVYVDDDADPGWYDATHVRTIQEGIDNATAGDTVFVYNGTYYENVVVDKTLDLIGEDRNSTVIDGSRSGDIVAISTNNVNISSFSIVNGTNGLFLWSCSNNIINKNIIKYNTRIGISLSGSDEENIISNNIIMNNSNAGIKLENTSNFNTIEYNQIIGNGDTVKGGGGILVFASSGPYPYHQDNNTIRNNIIESNKEYGIFIMNGYSSSPTNNSIYHNNFNGNLINSFDGGNNYWDDGHPSGGNYWGDYLGIDEYHGPNQDIPGSDGIGDTPYPISGGSNNDNYPFMCQNGWLNTPPNEPSSPHPKNHKTDVNINADLSWTCSDPDGDPLTYDVYFGTISYPPKVVSNQSGTSYNPGTLNYGEKYYWKIVAHDNHCTWTEGPRWDFTTEAEPNSPPCSPCSPNPSDSETGVTLNPILSVYVCDANLDNLTVKFYNASNDQCIGTDYNVTSGMSASTQWDGLSYNTTYGWYAVADDGEYQTRGPTSGYWEFTTRLEINYPPNKPSKPSGITSGINGVEYSYTSTTTDPDGNQVFYKWDWGDGSYSDWLGPYNSGEEVSASHVWGRGSYDIKVKAKDEHEAESDWSDPLPVTMPKNKAINTPFLQFLENHPYLFPILRLLLEL